MPVKTIKRSNKDISRAKTIKIINQLFDRVERNNHTCTVSLNLTFNQGGVRASTLQWEFKDFLRNGLPAEDEGIGR